LIFPTGDIGQDILHPAVQDPAEVIDGRGGNGLVFAELVDGRAGNTVVFDEGVGGFRRAPQGFPKTIVTNHISHILRFSYILGCIIYLDYSRLKNYIMVIAAAHAAEKKKG
jgi:hypothetical protein